MLTKSNLIVGFSEIDREDIDQVGKEALKLSEIQKLGIPTPKGFLITANAYRQFLLANQEIPENLVKAIFRAYKSLDKPLSDATVMVGSSFSRKKFENVKGEANLMQKIRRFWNIYSEGKEIDYPDFEPAIFFYKWPTSAQTGVMFTIDPIDSDKRIIVIKERNITGDQYQVSKIDLKIVNRAVNKRGRQTLTDKQIIDLGTWGRKLQEHYYFPQEVHFVTDRKTVYITKTRPITTIGPKGKKNTFKLLLKGNSIYPGIATGYLRVIRRHEDIHKLMKGDIAIVVSNSKNLRLGEISKKARGVVIESRSYRLSHLSLAPRAVGKPMLVSPIHSSKDLRSGIVATINGATGELYI